MQVPVEARQKYLERRKQDITASKEALLKLDYHFLERLGHQVKGNAITFGFDELTNIAVAIEQAAKAKNITQLQTLVEQLETAVNNAHL
ncbi:MAG: Hpt domain-containing protein [Pseudobdellovibrio sp.]|nr:Hpt domain-containing protein [Pseudobdellovibrio sp.]